MNSSNKTSVVSKQAKQSHTTFVGTLVGKLSVEKFSVQQLLQVKLKTIHL
jgi:hypothetical protein